MQAGGRHVGLIVDEGREFLRLAASDDPPAAGIALRLEQPVRAGHRLVKERLILVLELDQLVNFAEPLTAA